MNYLHDVREAERIMARHKAAERAKLAASLPETTQRDDPQVHRLQELDAQSVE
jgi:hypothetical protein